MRFEAKHRFFKHLAKVTGNFKNILKTLATRHQRYMTWLLSEPKYYLQETVECGKCKFDIIMNIMIIIIIILIIICIHRL